MSNFSFLQAEWPGLYDEALRAERIAVADPRASCFYARRALEVAVTWLYRADNTLRPPYRDDLAAMIAEPTMVNLVGPAIRTKMDIIRRQGNAAVHRPGPVAANDSVKTVAELFHVMYWIARRYSRNPADLPASGLVFDQSAIPRPLPAEVRLKKQAELKAQAEKYAKLDAELAAAHERDADKDAEIARLQAEIMAAKATNAAQPDTHDYNEAETRHLIIDLLLKEAGWALDNPQDREFEVTGMPYGTGTGYVDYVLWGDDGKPLAVVEAKRTTHDSTKGQQQAKLYADCLERMYGQRPVIFYTNGYKTHLWDDLRYPPREVQGFYSKDELRLLVQRRASRQPLAGVGINEQIAGRHYQTRAIRRIGETFERDLQRQALLVMATGAGKTRTVIGLVDQLIRANWAKRVLFLADRKALVTQATNAFKQHLAGVPTINLLTEKNPEARVYVSTYPTMMGLINETSDDLRIFGPGYFDLIVIDEAHRSIYQKYGAIFDYFDALLVGLTATPKDEVDRNTYRRFHLEDGVPTDVYSLDEAVDEDYLVPPRTVDVPLKFQREGIRYDDLSEEDKERWDELEWDDEGNVPDSVNSEELNKYLFNSDTVDKALEALMTHGLKVAGGDRLGKTIIFAKNNAHADFIAERFNANYPEFRDEFARVITYQYDYAQDLIDKFAQKEKDPHIAISVDMLDTGIDVPEVVNLVFFKLVRSKSKFWQMIGRGTRLSPDLFGPGQDKSEFMVFDLCQNVEFFNQDLMPAEGRLGPSLGERLFQNRADLLLRLDQRHPDLAGAESDDDPEGTRTESGLRWAVAHHLHRTVENMNPDNFLVRPHRRQVEVYADFSHWHRLTPEAHTELTEHLAALPTQYRDDDTSEEAKRFDLLALRLQLAQLKAEPGWDRLRTQVQEIASALLDSTTIPAIRAQQQLLDELAGDAWWQDVTLPMLEAMRRRVRGLVKLIPRKTRTIVYTDFEDELGEITSTELRGVALGTEWSRFEQKVRAYLRKHEDHLAVQKLRHNRQITTTDLTDLERIFVEQGIGTDTDLERAKQEAGGLGLFLRSLSGLDRGAATAAFDQFQEGRTLASGQLDFLQQIVDFLAQRGIMEAGDLYEAPFTAITPTGPEEIFAEEDVDIVVTILDAIRVTAIPQEQAS
ncbi:DEAD/DEAH box helicase family protein [Streptomyces sp. CS7]|uniref:DEAD/DEAH box helicase family protein n=1 Tax=Streptomyces sp. CS-7 TaxID=2906769 RepID=UPI0021B4849A|nr:DEAD/DEAH box helicase family protein [Streptomyces sp. CS-7]MCT6775392.1 DEAD/DEAH box helicase family protein [Streptomyces sp. CS-7]